MYSSDTRVPAIVAQSNNGSFEKLMEIEAAQLWIKSIIEDMDLIQQLPDDKLNFSQKEINSNKAFWKSVSSPDEFVKNNIQNTTRSIDRDIVPKGGHYELIESITYSEVYDSISRMTDTNWSQGYPYNYYCPLKSNSNSNHAPAGCVAIAAAQMLYYLHDNYSVPQTAPSEAYCDGNIDSYSWAQTNYTSTIWNYMNSSGYYAAPLIADIGRRVKMKYGNDGSGAYTKDLVNNVFIPYGIYCTYSNYDTEQLKNSLLNNMSVLLDAYSTPNTNSTSTKVGHAFISDRYKRIRYVTRNFYEWDYDYDSPDVLQPFIPRKYEYTYSSPQISMIGMNWGWGEFYNDSTEWFSLTGNWISKHYSSYNWNISRHMISGFQVINNN